MYIPISWRRLLLNKRHLLLNRRCLLLNRRRPLLNMSFNRTPASGIHLARALYLVRANLRQRIEKVMTFGTFIQRTGLIYGHSDFKSGHKSSKKSLRTRLRNFSSNPNSKRLTITSLWKPSRRRWKTTKRELQAVGARKEPQE